MNKLNKILTLLLTVVLVMSLNLITAVAEETTALPNYIEESSMPENTEAFTTEETMPSDTLMIDGIPVVTINQKKIYDAGDLIIKDDTGCLKNEEIAEIVDSMETTRKYCHVALLMIDDTVDIKAIAKQTCYDYFEDKETIVLVLNTFTREIYLYANGEVSELLTTTQCISIVESCYKEAISGKYSDCAMTSSTSETGSFHFVLR